MHHDEANCKMRTKRVCLAYTMTVEYAEESVQMCAGLDALKP
jgi:hypothetical protein